MTAAPDAPSIFSQWQPIGVPRHDKTAAPLSHVSPPQPRAGVILGLSFSLETGSIAVLQPDGQVHERVLEGHRSHASDALATVTDLLEAAGVETRCGSARMAAGIAAVAADAGPGGFTGLRTACGLAQGMAIGWQVPVVAISSLSLMACAALSEMDRDAVCVAALDARQQEVYVAVWYVRQGQVTELLAPRVMPYGTSVADLVHPLVQSAGSSLQTLPLVAAGPGCQHLSVDVALMPAGLMHRMDLLPSAGVLVQLAAQAVDLGQGLDAVHCQPLYVRNQVAMTTAERLARSGG